ncbi:hypothetical protein ELH38_29355 (plasmid) [Rhizobium ruizarguesonis]|nr:hypothetical protein ELH38_29355 [Rhizobium ruizarguesonis]
MWPIEWELRRSTLNALEGNGYQQFVPRRFHRFPTIHYAIFLAKNMNTLATSRALASKAPC